MSKYGSGLTERFFKSRASTWWPSLEGTNPCELWGCRAVAQTTAEQRKAQNLVEVHFTSGNNESEVRLKNVGEKSTEKNPRLPLQPLLVYWLNIPDGFPRKRLQVGGGRKVKRKYVFHWKILFIPKWSRHIFLFEGDLVKWLAHWI